MKGRGPALLSRPKSVSSFSSPSLLNGMDYDELRPQSSLDSLSSLSSLNSQSQRERAPVVVVDTSFPFFLHYSSRQFSSQASKPRQPHLSTPLQAHSAGDVFSSLRLGSGAAEWREVGSVRAGRVLAGRLPTVSTVVEEVERRAGDKHLVSKLTRQSQNKASKHISSSGSPKTKPLEGRKGERKKVLSKAEPRNPTSWTPKFCTRI